MTTLPADPLAEGGLEGFARRFRSGEITSEEATRAYLARIEALDPRLGAYQYVAAETALETARAMDKLRAAGTDLGPLMGVPISIKDLLAVDGMPLTAGSKIDISDLADPKEGPFVKALKRSGCVILGKTKMVEFALGITGVSEARGTPWNPWDMETQRLPGGSSSGAGVSVAAGLCALAIGSDTGGSVRVPAALCGVFGLKTTFGLWSLEGAFPLAAHLDSLGLLTRSARDAAIAYAEITAALYTGMKVTAPPTHLGQLRFGNPGNYFFDGLDSEVESATKAANEALSAAGVAFEDFTLPEASEREAYFPVSLPVRLIATLGRERFEKNKSLMDPVIATRVENALEVRASEYEALEAKRARSMVRAVERFAGMDAWISPTAADVPSPVADLEDPKRGLALALGMTRNTQPGNYLGLCAASLPLPREAGQLPVGYQIMCPPGNDARLLSIAIAVEDLLGKPRLPEMEV